MTQHALDTTILAFAVYKYLWRIVRVRLFAAALNTETFAQNGFSNVLFKCLFNKINVRNGSQFLLWWQSFQFNAIVLRAAIFQRTKLILKHAGITPCVCAYNIGNLAFIIFWWTSAGWHCCQFVRLTFLQFICQWKESTTFRRMEKMVIAKHIVNINPFELHTNREECWQTTQFENT